MQYQEELRLPNQLLLFSSLTPFVELDSTIHDILTLQQLFSHYLTVFHRYIPYYIKYLQTKTNRSIFCKRKELYETN